MEAVELPLERDWCSDQLAQFVNAGLLKTYCSIEEVVARSQGRLCYLASPYAKRVQTLDGRFDLVRSMAEVVVVANWARVFAQRNVTAVSPIIQACEMVHTQANTRALDPLDAVFWERWCAPLLARSEVVIVPPIEGALESDGIWAELRYALARNVPCFVMDASACEVLPR